MKYAALQRVEGKLHFCDVTKLTVPFVVSGDPIGERRRSYRQYVISHVPSQDDKEFLPTTSDADLFQRCWPLIQHSSSIDVPVKRLI